MKYRIEAVERTVAIVGMDGLISALIYSKISDDHEKAKALVKSWRSTRGYVSPACERLIRSILEPMNIHLTTRDFWSEEAWMREEKKFCLPDTSRQAVPA